MDFNLFQAIRSHLHYRQHKRILPIYQLPENSKVLDISCGDGNLLAQMHSNQPPLRLYGSDISEVAVKQAAKNCPWGNFIQGPAEHLPYVSRQFDAVVSCMSLHHYKNSQTVFNEVARVLTPQGKFFLIDFFSHNRWSQYFNNWCGCPENYHFEKYYTKNDVEALAGPVGMLIQDEFSLGFLSGQYCLSLAK